MRSTPPLFILALSSLLVASAPLMGCNSETDEPDPEANVSEDNDNSNANGDDKHFTESTEYPTIEVTRIAHPLDHPWAVAPLPDGRHLVTERGGALKLIDDGEITDVDGVPDVHATNQGGLLDVVLHPDFEDNQTIYLTYSRQEEGGSDTTTALARAEFDDDGPSLENLEELFAQDRYSEPGRHYGSRVAWLSDGTLLLTVGDRGADPPRAQDTDDHAGSVLRLTEDGDVPDDNPFVDDDDVLDEIWTYGNRNIQGIVVADDDTVWATEHGPRGGDLLHRLEPGLNYGWPTVTQGLNYADQEPFPDMEARSMEGIEDPFYEFLPTHAPSGLALITTDRFQHWEGNLLAGGLRSERIRRVTFDDEEVLHEEELLLQRIGRIRDVREDPNGDILVATDRGDGGLYRITPD